MFRKIHSNQPENSVFAEMGTIFSPYIKLAGSKLGVLLLKKPKVILIAMIVSILLSVCYQFGFSKRNKISDQKLPVPKMTSASPLTSIGKGLGAITETAQQIRQNMVLQRSIDSVLAKKQLGLEDSIFLEHALKNFQTLNQKTNENKP